MNADFSRLYAELGVGPDCSGEVFTHACRRRIADRHPDRAIPGGDDGGIPIDELLSLHAHAMRFHARHGRLPGAARCPPVDAPRRASAAPGTGMVPVARPRYRGMRTVLFVVLACTLVVMAVGSPEPLPTVPVNVRSAAAAATRATPVSLPRSLELGMDAATVRAIQGEPLGNDAVQWDYGPSWLRFEDGHLVDWYSSPLNRLKVASTSPATAAEAR